MAVDAGSIWDLSDSMAGAGPAQAQTRLAQVSRTDGEGRVWVSFPGGEPETPTETTDAEVRRGDTVTVEWRAGKLHIIGNSTDPAVGTGRVGAVEQAVDEVAVVAGEAKAESEQAAEFAREADAVATATSQHFWHRATAPEGDTAGTGAFVTDEAQEDFLAAIAAGTEPTTARPLHNLLMNAEGILLRAAKRIRAAFLPSGVAFYDGEGNAASNIVARFGSDGAQIGKASGNHVDVTSSGMEVLGGSESLARFGGSGARIGKSAGGHLEISGDGLGVYSGSTLVSNIFAGAENKDSYLNLSDISMRCYQSTTDVGTVSAMAQIDVITYDGSALSHDASLFISAGKAISGAQKSPYLHLNTSTYEDPPDTFYDYVSLGFFDAHGLGEDVFFSNGVETRIKYLTEDSIPDLSSTYLPISGGTLTGALNGTTASFSGDVSAGGNLTLGNGAAGTQYYLNAKTPSRTDGVLFVGGGKKSDGSSGGTVVGLGAGGLTIVGGGEYAESRYNVADLNDTAEYLYLGSDNDVYIETNGNTIANRKTFRFSTGGVFWTPKDGAIETGPIIDLHRSGEASSVDFMARITADSNGALQFSPTYGGFSSTNQVRSLWEMNYNGRLAVRKNDGSAWGSWSYYQFGNAGRIEASGPFTMNTSLALGTAANAHPLEVFDSSGVIIAQNRVGVTADSKSYNYLVARQGTSSSGGIKQVSFGIACDASGTATYRVDNPDGFRDAIGLKDPSAAVTAIASVIAAGTNVTIKSVRYQTFGKVATVSISFTKSTATPAGGGFQVGTIVDGKRPATEANCGSNAYCGHVGTAGGVHVRNIMGAQIAANTELHVNATYILP